MFSLLSNEIAESLRAFLGGVLNEISDNWWNSNVISVLSYQQQRIVEEKRISSLSDLDLAALLRVIDKNWYDISRKRTITGEARSWIREMQHIRNKWAHVTGQPSEPEDTYRDLDTLQRFLSVINADSSLIELIKQRKMDCFASEMLAKKDEPEVTKTQDANPSSPRKEPYSFTKFITGDTVFLKADPSLIGPVMQAIPGKPENRYTVWTGNKPTQFYESQLDKFEPISNTIEILSLDNFHAHLSALQLQHPGLANLYSLHAARVNYIPYQFKPVIKLVRSDRPRILIADEVGVGKTIEAGLILRELQARRDLTSVLIICPRPLVTEHKWRNEMKRFDEEFTHLDGATLRFCIDETDKDGCWPTRYSKAILPFSLFNEELFIGSSESKKRRKKGLLDLDPLPHFDLIIVDEAHHLRNPGTWLHQGVQFLCANAEAVAFLSATPVQLGEDDLFVLLNLLRPDLIIDKAVFQNMSAPNPFINQAIELARRGTPDWQPEALEQFQKAAHTEWGKAVLRYNPDFQKLFDLLNDRELITEKRISFIREAERLHTFSSIINRTRRRDIGTFTTRKPETVEVPFSPSQQKMHDDLLEIQARILHKLHGDKNLLFMMSTIKRQAASCIYGLAPLLKDILTRKLDALELDEIDDTIDGESLSFSKLEDKILEILERTENLDTYDPKLLALMQIIENKQELSNNKILLFSSFRHTLAYLLDKLDSANVRIGYIHGNTADDDRHSQRNRFSLPREDPDALDLLLSSEVGCEGLDYQFCDCLVNYDLPWNPMRVEQRIGRIDRYGQKSETVAIYNLITPGTVDADIYFRCLWRIGVFRAALGGSEEIIGKLTTELKKVAENFNLSPEERQARLQQLSDNEIRIIQEQSDLEEQQSELFGLRLPQQENDAEVLQSSSFWLTPNALQRLVSHYLEKSCGSHQEYLLGEKLLKTLRLSQDGRDVLLTHFKQLPKKATPLFRDWEKWLKGNNQHLTLTFESTCAAEHPEAVFVTPVHPLALQAARASIPELTFHTAFRVISSSVKQGNYPFAIYHWKKRGIREDACFQPVCIEADINSQFFHLLEKGVSIPIESVLFPAQDVFDSLDSQHHIQWSAARLEHVSNNNELVRFRRESLRTSHAARMAVLREQLASATNDKIRLMRKSQLEIAEADYSRRLDEIERARHQADITFDPVAFGVMVVVEGDK